MLYKIPRETGSALPQPVWGDDGGQREKVGDDVGRAPVTKNCRVPIKCLLSGWPERTSPKALLTPDTAPGRRELST